MVSDLLFQVQIIWQLYLIELLGLLVGLETTQVVALDVSKNFDRFWHAGFLHILKSYETSSQVFVPILSFFSNRQLRVVLNGQSLQEYPVHVGAPQGSILGPTLFYYTLMSFLMMLSVILLSIQMTLPTTLIFDRSNIYFAIDLKMDGSFLQEKSTFKMLRWSFSSELDYCSYMISIAKTTFQKIGSLIHYMKFLCSEVTLYHYKYTIQPYREY